jgi:methionine sulfoxide reductase heme-binding subunit
MSLAATSLPWYAARASGIVAFVLLTVATLLGVALAGGARNERWPRFAVEDVHGFVGLLAGGFLVLHGLSLLVDRYVPLSLLQLVVPGLAPSRPLATAPGVLAAELLAALALTNRYRRRLPYRLWRRAHYLNFAVWLLALVHGVTVGTDGRTPWMTALYALACGSVAGLVLWRALARTASLEVAGARHR